MIVISGALAVVAFVLLIAGLVADGLGLVYASIAVSLVSAIFLGVGAFQRRGEEVATARPATPSPTPRPADPVRAGASDASAFGDDGETTVRIADPAVGAPAAGSVLVVPGRPRYHVEGCRYLAGKDGETRSLAEARNEGYTACGICRPDENLAAPTPALVGGAGDGDGADAGDGDDDAAAKPAHTESAPTTARRSTARRTAARPTAAKKATAKKATAKKATAKKATPKRTTATKATATKATAKKATAKKATAKQTTATKATAKKATAKKSTAKKSTAKTSTAKKTAAKRSTAKKATRRR